MAATLVIFGIYMIGIPHATWVFANFFQAFGGLMHETFSVAAARFVVVIALVHVHLSLLGR